MFSGRIGHLHCRYQIADESRGPVASRLDRVVREHLSQACESAFARAFGEDPAIVVVRHIDTVVSLGRIDMVEDPAIAGRWGAQVAGVVAERVSAGGPDVATFEDQSEFVASFVRDFLRGVAWDRWYYGAFGSLRHLSRAEVLHAVLLDHRNNLPSVLRRLASGRDLDHLLRSLAGPAIRELWTAIAGDTLIDRESFRPLVAQALELAGDLGLVDRNCEVELLLDAFVAAGPAPLDWRSARMLATAIFAIVRFATGLGYLRRPEEAANPSFETRLDAALASFDWVDAGWLGRNLVEFWTEGSSGRKSEAFTRPGRNGATPKQRELLADLLAVLREDGIHLDRSAPMGAENGLRWYASLIARSPRWKDDPIATALIGRFLAAWAVLTETASPERLLSDWQTGRFAAAPKPALAIVDHLGGPAAAILAELHEVSLSRKLDASRDLTECAGLFFLVRTIRDMRLPWLVRDAAYPAASKIDGVDPLSALLWGVGRGLAGPLHESDATADPGLPLFAGVPDGFDVASFEPLWAETTPVDHARFQSRVVTALAEQRLLENVTLRLERLTLERGEVLVAGVADSPLWLFGCVIDGSESLEETISSWLDSVEATTGERPSVIAGSSLSAELAALVPAISAEAVVASHDDFDGIDLTADLDALALGPTGRLDVDLTLALTGIALLRAWARWLPRFGQATTPYLLRSFVRRPGRISVDPDVIVIDPEPGPLDVLLDLAGYREEMEQVPWLGGKRVRFER